MLRIFVSSVQKELSQERLALRDYLQGDVDIERMGTGIRRLLDNHWIELTIPEKPGSRLQKYRLTAEGRRLFAARKAGKIRTSRDE